MAFCVFGQISLIVVVPIILDFVLEIFGIEVWKRSLITILTRFGLFTTIVTKLDLDVFLSPIFVITPMKNMSLGRKRSNNVKSNKLGFTKTSLN